MHGKRTGALERREMLEGFQEDILGQFFGIFLVGFLKYTFCIFAPRLPFYGGRTNWRLVFINIRQRES